MKSHNDIMNIMYDIKSSSKRVRYSLLRNDDIVEYLKGTFPNIKIEYSVNLLLENLTSIPKCNNTNCSNDTAISTTGIGKFCSKKCSLEHNKVENNLKRKNTNIEKYGCENPLSNKEVREKISKTTIEKYGMKVSPKSLAKIKERASNFITIGRETIKEKYGVDNAILIDGIITKRSKSNIEKYGSNYFPNSRKKELPIIKGIEVVEVINPSIEDKELYPHKNDIIKFKCICGNVEEHPYETYKFRIRNFATPCSICSNIKDNISKAENDLVQFFKDQNITVESNTRNIIPPKELDIYLPEYNIAIEYNGLYWHSEERGRDKNYHLNKTNECSKKGIKLIHIFEDEWIYKKEIVKSRLNSYLGKSDIIYARKTKLELITSKDAMIFCNENHIQGGVNSKINLGLKYNNELVSVMTFSKVNSSRGKQDIEYELVRFCNKLNTTVVGGASKLFSYFVKNYSPNEILSYSNNRWSGGDLYSILGFKNEGNTSPGYWYIKNNKRYHRYNFTKHKLVEMGHDKNKSESEIMRELGYSKIWDCGNAKWKWEK